MGVVYCFLEFQLSQVGVNCVWVVPAVAGLGFVVLAPFPGWGCVFLFWVVPWSLTVPNGPNAIACAGVGNTHGDATVLIGMSPLAPSLFATGIRTGFCGGCLI